MTFYEIIKMNASEYPYQEWVFPKYKKFKNEDGITSRVELTGEVKYSAEEFSTAVDDQIRKFINLGIKNGDTICLLMNGTEEWFLTFFAAIALGCKVVTMNTGSSNNDLEFQLKDSNPKYVFTDNRRAKAISEICKQGNYYIDSSQVITTEPNEFGYRNFVDLQKDEIIDIGNYISYDSGSVCNIQYTSGTTSGHPKGAMLTQEQIIKNGFDIGEGMNISDNDRLLIQVPMYHCFGIVLSMTNAITHGSSMVILPQFSNVCSADAIERYDINWMNGVPTMYSRLLKKAPDVFDRIEKGIMAGAECTPTRREEVSSRGMKVYIVYGLTEASPGCTITNPNEDIQTDYSSVGHTLPDVTVTIRDENGNILPDDIQGEICIEGYNVMTGYLNNPEATDTVIKQGVLHTGDIGVMHNGELYYISRLKDMIIRGGENVTPNYVEQTIEKNFPELVGNVQVVGIADEDKGEEVAACIHYSGAFPYKMVVEEIVASGVISPKDMPKYFVFVPEFNSKFEFEGEPILTPSGKIKKHILSTYVEKMVNGINAGDDQMSDGQSIFAVSSSDGGYSIYPDGNTAYSY